MQFNGSVGGDEELWYGKVTTTGASTITFNWSSSVASDGNEYGAQEFSAGLGASTVWAIDKAGSLNGASSTSVPFPSLTPSATGELYFGYSLVANTAAAGTASGFTYGVTAQSNAVAYDTNVSGAVSPAGTQSPAGTSSAVGMLLSASTGAPPPPPTVTGVSPSTGSTAGGTTVTISGTNFTGASAVKFGTVAATSFTVTNAGSISAVSPAEGAATVDVTVTVGANTSAVSQPADQFTFTVPPPPTVTGVSPSTGSTAGGTTVTISGTNFTGASAVKFGTVAATSFTVTNAGSISAVSPAEGAATVDVTVTVGANTSAVSPPADQFTFSVPSSVITAVGTLASADASGLTTLTVSPKTVGDVLAVFAQVSSATGTTVSSVSGGGVTTWTKAMQFNGSVGADAELWYGKVTTTGSSTITFKWSGSITGHIAEYGAQEFSAGLGASTVWAMDKAGSLNGASSTSVPFPSLTPSATGELYFGYSVVANTAAAGTTTGFTYGVTAEANAVAYDTNVSGAVSPAGTQSPAGTSSAVGMLLSASTGAPPPPPTVTGVSPSTGSTAGGTTVTISGTNFTGASAVKFGTVAATSFTVTNAGSISAVSPAEGAATVDVTVTVGANTSAVSQPADQFTFTVPPPPTVTGVSPSTGSTAGGTTVTISGTNFTGASAVKFGTVAATSFTVTNAGSISAVSPAEGAATVDVTVTVGANTSAVSPPADQFTFSVPSSVITAVGTLASADASGLTTLTVSPKTVGDVLAVFAQVSSATGTTVSSVSGGGVTTWTKAMQFNGSVGADAELWYGKVTTTGSSTITFKWSGSITGHIAEYGAQEFSAGLGASTVWAMDKAGSLNGASSTSVPFPSLTPSATGELYFGYSVVANTAAAGTTTGFTYGVTAEANAVAYDTNVSGAVSPAGTQSPAGTSSAVGMLLSVSP